MSDIHAPDYYAQFECIGPRCEDTCCSGSWQVSIDQRTYQKYAQSTHPVLAPLFKLAIHKNTTPSADEGNNFGLMQMKADGSCHFQQEDKLCAIHGHLGAQALSDTCSIYPRYLNRFGAQRENALGISCPEAARLILLNPQPMQFGLIESTPGLDDRPTLSYRFPLKGEGDPAQIAVLNDVRAVIIMTLQCRALSVGARMMTLGFLLAEVERITLSTEFSHASELLPTLGAFANMLAQPATLETQFEQIQAQMPRKLELVTSLIAQSLMFNASPRLCDCLLAAAQGLEAGPDGNVLERYTTGYQQFYQPFFQTRCHIIEHYLVNHVITRLFPFTSGSYLDLYRDMVFNLSILQVLLVGMAAHHQGLNETRVLQLFQSFARRADHSQHHLTKLREALQPTDQDSFVDVMWLLKESAAR
jgi:lysine-N-methylase